MLVVTLSYRIPFEMLRRYVQHFGSLTYVLCVSREELDFQTKKKKKRCEFSFMHSESAFSRVCVCGFAFFLFFCH